MAEHVGRKQLRDRGHRIDRRGPALNVGPSKLKRAAAGFNRMLTESTGPSEAGQRAGL
jgi:hypothetical protein